MKLPDLLKDFGAVSAKAADFDKRMSAVPAKPEDYKLELTKDYKLPDGVKWEWDQTNPVLAQARKFAQEAGLSQDQFSALTTMFVATKVGERQALDKMIADGETAEKQKLGANGPARIDAAKAALTARVGKDRAEAFFDRPIIAADLELIEDLLKGQGATFTQQHRETPPPAEKTLPQKLWPKRQVA